MTTNGYIKLHRSILANSLYADRERYCKRAAWVDILLNVNQVLSTEEIGALARAEDAGAEQLEAAQDAPALSAS